MGLLNANQFYTLSYSIDITTGVVTNLNLSDSVGAETIASPGTLPGFSVNRTNAKFLVVSSSGNSASQFGYVDNLAVTCRTGSERHNRPGNPSPPRHCFIQWNRQPK